MNITAEEAEAQLKEQESFLSEMGHLLDSDTTEADLSHLDSRTRNKILHLELLEKQSRELIDLQNSGASYNREETLRLKHAKQEDEFILEINSALNSIENDIIKIQAKKYITVKEFSEIYNIQKTSQQNYRARLNDPLPYHQKVEGGKIVYVVEEVEKWFDNQHR